MVEMRSTFNDCSLNKRNSMDEIKIRFSLNDIVKNCYPSRWHLTDDLTQLGEGGIMR